MRRTILAFAISLSLTARAQASTLAPGVYTASGHTIYVGVEHELNGKLDRNVDAADAATHLREYLTRAGDRDVTIKTYPNAGHQLIVSKSGYNGEPAPPERFVSGYPQIMITRLAQRGFTM